MQIHHISQENTILNKFLAEIRKGHYVFVEILNVLVRFWGMN